MLTGKLNDREAVSLGHCWVTTTQQARIWLIMRKHETSLAVNNKLRDSEHIVTKYKCISIWHQNIKKISTTLRMALLHFYNAN